MLYAGNKWLLIETKLKFIKIKIGKIIYNGQT